jgi:hypothetical protein
VSTKCGFLKHLLGRLQPRSTPTGTGINVDCRIGRPRTVETGVNTAQAEDLIWEVADSTILRQWKWLFMNDCKWKSPAFAATKLLTHTKTGQMYQCAVNAVEKQ